jgi:AraC family transcriptional regulator
MFQAQRDEHRPAIRRLQLHDSAALRAHLVHYAPGLRQSAHCHESLQVSFLLLGAFEEHSGARVASPPCKSLGIRPAGTSHAVAFGEEGALMLSLEVLAGDDSLPATPCSWRMAHPALGATLRAAFAASDVESRADTLWDLLALASTSKTSPSAMQKPARWLKQVAEAIKDDPASFRVAEAARRAGVHRVHLSRCFTVTYGQAPSLFRLRCMAARAIANVLCDGLSLADAAAQAGFADQSHFTRTFAREIGTGPSQLRRQLGTLHSFKTPGRAAG